MTDIHQGSTFITVTLTSQKPCQHSNKFEFSKTNTINVMEKKMIQGYFIEKPLDFSVACMELVDNADRTSLDR